MKIILMRWLMLSKMIFIKDHSLTYDYHNFYLALLFCIVLYNINNNKDITSNVLDNNIRKIIKIKQIIRSSLIINLFCIPLFARICYSIMNYIFSSSVQAKTNKGYLIFRGLQGPRSSAPHHGSRLPEFFLNSCF